MTTSVNPLNPSSVNAPAAEEVDQPDAQRAAAPAADNHPAPAPAPAPNLADAVQNASARLDQLLHKAALQMPSMEGSLAAQLKAQIPRPGLLRSGRSIHPTLIEAAERCDRAAQDLAKIPAGAFKSPDVMNPNADSQAFKTLQAYTEAQNELYGKLVEYTKATGKSSPLLTSAIQATQFRAAEAINLAACLNIAAREGQLTENETTVRARMEALGDLDNRSTVDVMASTTSVMHVGKLKEAALQQAVGLADKLDRLEANRQDLTVAHFQAEASQLAREVAVLRGALPTHDPKHPAQGMLEDLSLNNAFKALLDRAESRLEHMRNSDPRDQIRHSFDDLFPKLSTDDVDAFVDTLPSSLRKFGKALADTVKDYNQLAVDVKGKIDDVDVTSAGFKDECRRLVVRFNQPHDGNAKVAKEALRLASAVHGGHLNLKEFGAILRRNTHMTIEDSAVKAFYGWAQEGNSELPDIARLAETLSSSIFTTTNEIRTAEINELAGMIRSFRSDGVTLTSDYVATALEHDLSIDTIVNAKLRGIPVDQLETRADPRSLVSQRILGQGAVNAVTLCQYNDKDGTPLTLVFKPEVGARHGLAHLVASNCGYHGETRVMQLNIATTISADQIGVGDVVARSKIGMLNGTMGLFMEAAPGKEAVKWRSEFPAVAQELRQNGHFEKARGQLMRALSNLDWADALSGQVDRHNSNYLVDINPKTGDVKVTGIDNDASFGTQKVGLTTFLTAGIKKELRVMMGVDGQPRVDGDSLDNDELMALRSSFGLNQISKPTHIDRDTFDRLMAVNVQDYQARLSTCLEPDAVRAAVSRLQDAKNHARQLEQWGRVVDGDAWSSEGLFNSVLGMQVKALDNSGQEHYAAFVRNGFFARDFADLFDRA